MTQFIKPQNWGGKSGWEGDMLKSVYDPNNVEANAFDYNNFINTPEIPAAQVQADWNEADNTKVDYIKNKPTIPAAQIQSDWNQADNTKLDFIKNKPNLSVYQTTANLVTDLNNPDNTHYPSAKAVSDAISWGWNWDMLKSVYDPNNIEANAFDYNNFINTPTIPTDTSDLTNWAWFITGIDSWDVTTALWYTPYNSTNPSGYVTSSIISDTAYGSWWDGDTTHAPTKNAVYDKIDSIDDVIPSAATSSNKLADKNYVDDSINSVTAYYITKNAAWDQFATYAELAAATTFYSGWVARTPTRNDYCIVVADENHDDATTRYIYNSGWEYQYTVNETALTTAQLNALNSWITAAKVTTYDGYASWKQDTLTTQTAYTTKGSATKVPQITTNTLGQVTWITEVTITHPSQVSDTAYWNSWDWVTSTAPSQNAVYDKISAMDTTIAGKQNTLTTQTAYTTKWTATKVPTITTNTLWQVTAITETNITFPVTSVNGSTGAVTVSEFTPSWTATTWYVVKKTADWYWWAAESWAVTSVNWQTWAVTVSEFTPTSSGSTDQVLTKTAWWYDWATPAASWIICDPNSPITIDKIRCWTEAQYSALWTYSSTTAYLTI